MDKSRQVQRAEFRSEVKRGLQVKIARTRKDRQRALLERQSARENDGFYTGRGTRAAVAPSRSRIAKRKVQKGKAFGRILLEFTESGRERSLHATKGWRSHRAA